MAKEKNNRKVNKNKKSKHVVESRDPAELLMTNVEDSKKMMAAKQNAELTNLDKKRIVNDAMDEMK